MLRLRAILATSIGLGALASMAAVLGFGAGSPEAVLSRGYTAALADVDPVWERRLTGNLWLSSLPTTKSERQFAPVQVNPLRRALAIGDRIKISARDGGDELIEVVAIEHVDADGLGLGALQFQIVTGRTFADGPAETVRFLFAVDGGHGASAPAERAPAKSL